MAVANAAKMAEQTNMNAHSSRMACRLPESQCRFLSKPYSNGRDSRQNPTATRKIRSVESGKDQVAGAIAQAFRAFRISEALHPVEVAGG
jgi:hypothetical protein